MLTRKELNTLKLMYNIFDGENPPTLKIYNTLNQEGFPQEVSAELTFLYKVNYMSDGKFENISNPHRLTEKKYQNADVLLTLIPVMDKLNDFDDKNYQYINILPYFQKFKHNNKNYLLIETNELFNILKRRIYGVCEEYVEAPGYSEDHDTFQNIIDLLDREDKVKLYSNNVDKGRISDTIQDNVYAIEEIDDFVNDSSSFLKISNLPSLDEIRKKLKTYHQHQKSIEKRYDIINKLNDYLDDADARNDYKRIDEIEKKIKQVYGEINKFESLQYNIPLDQYIDDLLIDYKELFISFLLENNIIEEEFNFDIDCGILTSILFKSKNINVWANVFELGSQKLHIVNMEDMDIFLTEQGLPEKYVLFEYL